MLRSRTIIAIGALSVAAASLPGNALANAEKPIRPTVELQAAFNKMEDARSILQHATNDTESHRERAVELLEAAMKEVRAGIAQDGTAPKH